MADQILKGTDPKDIPIEGGQGFELFVNEEMAQALGIDPESIEAPD